MDSSSLYLAGQGKLTASGEIINLIIRDESIHGVFVGILTKIFAELSAEEQQEVQKNTRVINGTMKLKWPIQKKFTLLSVL